MAYRTYPVSPEAKVEETVAASHTLRVGWAFEALSALVLVLYFAHVI